MSYYCHVGFHNKPPIAKKEFKALYYKLSANKVAEELGITRNTVYFYVNKFKLKKKTELTPEERWLLKADLPETVKEYHEKYSGKNFKPVCKWMFKGLDEDREQEYLVKKIYIADMGQQKLLINNQKV